MRNRISALILDPQKDEHNYDDVRLIPGDLYYRNYSEHGFDLFVQENDKDVTKILDRERTIDCIVTIGDDNFQYFSELRKLPFEFRKRWVHFGEFDPRGISVGIMNVFLNNINRIRDDKSRLFSFFTCTYKTPADKLIRLYKSMKNQIYPNWNWYILDDTPDDKNEIFKELSNFSDPRIVILKNVTNHGVIGFNKHVIASAADGDYLVEVDHDDELTPDCLDSLNKAINMYPDSDFLYSHAIEEVNGRLVFYGNNFAYGLGEYGDFNVCGYGLVKHVAKTAPINALSVRGIHALPNHVRVWKSSFYKAIGGHNTELCVMDDMDLLVRTFLKGKITMVDKVLYIQHEGAVADRRKGETTTSSRFYEIQRLNDSLRMKYDADIHARIIELGSDDPFWVSDTIGSNVLKKDVDRKTLKVLCNVYKE